MSQIHFFQEDISYSWKGKRKAKAWLEQCILDHGKTPGEISIILCSDEFLLQMNKQYLDHDYYTDIITFDQCEGDIINGDLFISIDRIKDNAQKEGVSVTHELHRVMVHGVLHLLGLKDKTPKDQEKMRKAEDKYLTLQFG